MKKIQKAGLAESKSGSRGNAPARLGLVHRQLAHHSQERPAAARGHRRHLLADSWFRAAACGVGKIVLQFHKCAFQIFTSFIYFRTSAN